MEGMKLAVSSVEIPVVVLCQYVHLVHLEGGREGGREGEKEGGMGEEGGKEESRRYPSLHSGNLNAQDGWIIPSLEAIRRY